MPRRQVEISWISPECPGSLDQTTYSFASSRWELTHPVLRPNHSRTNLSKSYRIFVNPRLLKVEQDKPDHTKEACSWIQGKPSVSIIYKQEFADLLIHDVFGRCGSIENGRRVVGVIKLFHREQCDIPICGLQRVRIRSKETRTTTDLHNDKPMFYKHKSLLLRHPSQPDPRKPVSK